jgi:hypothetical protein
MGDVMMRFLLIISIFFLLLVGCSQTTTEEVEELPEENDAEEVETIEEEDEANEEESSEESPVDEEEKKEDPKDSSKEPEKPDTEAPTGDVPVTGPLSEEEAIERVEAHLDLAFDEEVKIFIDREQDGKFIVQVFDVVGGQGSEHTSTRGWFTVDRETGVVEPM